MRISKWWESFCDCCDWRQGVGFGAFAGYVLLLAVSPVFSTASTLVLTSWRSTLLLSAVIFFLLSFAVFSKWPDLLKGKRLLYLAFFGEIISAFGLIHSMDATDQTNQLLSAACVAFGLILLVLVWTKPFLQTELLGRVAATAASSIIGCLFYFVVVFLPEGVSFIAGLLLSVTSVFFYFLIWLKSETAEATNSDAHNAPRQKTPFGSKNLRGYPYEVKAIGSAIVFGFLFTVIGHAAPELENEWMALRTPGLLNVGFFLAIEIILAVVMVRVSRKASADIAYRPIILCFAIGLALLPFVSGEGIFLCTSLSLAGFGCAVVYYWIAMGNTCQRYNLQPAQVYSLSMLYPVLGMLIGELLVSAFVEIKFTGIQYSAAVSSIGLFLLVMILWQQASGAAFANETREMGGNEYGNAATTMSDHVPEFAKIYHLTEREQEVLELWINGRDVPYICEELFIAKNTAKTHIKHIYEKSGVNDKQALIDLVMKHD